MRPVRCPSCRLRIDGNHVWVQRNCAACGAVFKVRRHYFWTMYVLALVVSGGVAFAIGNRGTALSSLAGLLVLPMFWGMLMINLRLFPADIKVVREGWTPGGRLPLSTPKDPPVTFEGIAIAVALTALLAYHVYTAIEPHF